MNNIDTAINRIRAYAKAEGIKKTALAKAAGLGDTTLRYLDSDDWNPTINIVRKIEEIIPEDFVS